jgi:hypothetical protein
VADDGVLVDVEPLVAPEAAPDVDFFRFLLWAVVAEVSAVEPVLADAPASVELDADGPRWGVAPVGSVPGVWEPGRGPVTDGVEPGRVDPGAVAPGMGATDPGDAAPGAPPAVDPAAPGVWARAGRVSAVAKVRPKISVLRMLSSYL